MRYFLKSNGIISGKVEMEVQVGDDSLPWDAPIIQAFLNDEDLQEMTIVSTNIGFVKTITKHREATDAP